MIDLDEVVSAAPETCWGMVGENLVLFDPADRRLHVLNATAAAIWALTDAGVSVGDLVVRIGSEYRTAPSVVEPDVVDVVGRLLDAGLCVTEPAPARRAPPPDVEEVFSVPNTDALGPYEVLGSSVAIEVAAGPLRDELARVLAPLASPRPLWSTDLVYRVDVTDTGHDLSVSGRLIARGTSMPACLRTLLSDLNSTPLERLDEVIALHAGAVEVDGGITVLPGVSNSGKSTLVAQMAERGHAYLSDEAVLIDPETLRARPYHKAICLERGAQKLLTHLAPAADSPARDLTWDVDPRMVGRGDLSPGGPVTGLVFPIYRPHAPATARLLDPLEVMHRLLRNSFRLPPLTQVGFAALIRLANEVAAHELAHGGNGHLELLEDAVRVGPRLSF